MVFLVMDRYFLFNWLISVELGIHNAFSIYFNQKRNMILSTGIFQAAGQSRSDFQS